MRVVLHIGSTKTGSSALQTTLAARHEELVAAGVLYSRHGLWPVAGAHHLLAAAIHPGAWRMHRTDLPEDRPSYFAACAEAILLEARERSAHTIVLSSEYFWGSLAPQVYKAMRAAFPGADFEVVAFVRRQDAWANSSYLQAIKSGETRDFADWFRVRMDRPNSGLHYFRVINRWAWFLGASTVHVLRYEDTKANVYKALCERLQIEVDTTMPSARINPSPSAQGIELLLAVNRSDLPAEEKAAARREIMGRHISPGGNAMLISQADREAILIGAATSDALIVRHFLGGVGPLFTPLRTPSAEDLAQPLPESAR